MYGRSELSGAASVAGSHRSLLRENGHHDIPAIAESVKKDVRRLSNSVQAQIERMFTDVAKDATCSFSVICLGSLPLKDKVTSLQGLQEPLKQLYFNESGKIVSRNFLPFPYVTFLLFVVAWCSTITFGFFFSKIFHINELEVFHSFVAITICFTRRS